MSTLRRLNHLSICRKLKVMESVVYLKHLVKDVVFFGWMGMGETIPSRMQA